MSTEVRTRLRALLADRFGVPAVTPAEDLFAAGYFQSLHALQLVQELESHFEIVVEDDDLDLAHFRSVDAMTAFVVRKRGGP